MPGAVLEFAADGGRMTVSDGITRTELSADIAHGIHVKVA